MKGVDREVMELIYVHIFVFLRTRGSDLLVKKN